jgi:hypothetical protein
MKMNKAKRKRADIGKIYFKDEFMDGFVPNFNKDPTLGN